MVVDTSITPGSTTAAAMRCSKATVLATSTQPGSPRAARSCSRQHPVTGVLLMASPPPPNRSAPVNLLAEDRADVLEFRINGKRGDQVRPPCGTFVPIGEGWLAGRVREGIGAAVVILLPLNIFAQR